MTSLSYRPDLDGLRAVAVYLVVAFHARMATVDGGFVGVDLFFVLSGFLVTGVLLRDVSSHGRVRLGRFYARRVRRLLPAAALVIVAGAALQLLLLSLPARLDLVDDARASLLYVANWHFVLESRDYFAPDEAGSPFLHFWSLAIEEQFYIAFPLVVLAVARWCRRPVLVLGAVLVVIGAASLVLQVVTAGADPTLAYYGTHTRAYQLAAGGLLMVLCLGGRAGLRGPTGPTGSDQRTAADARLRVAGAVVAVLGLAGLLLTASGAVEVSASTRGILATAASVATIAGLWWAPRGPVAVALGLPLPRFLGQISYGTYLWHWPVVLLLQRVLDARPLAVAILTAVVATGLAALSYRVVEMPVRTARPLDAVSWRVVGGGLTASVLVAALVLPAILDRPGRPAVAPEVAQAPTAGRALDQPVPPDLDLVAAKAARGIDTADPCTVADPAACVMVEGGGPHVLLLGDSQASMFVPAFEALARDHDLRLSTNTLLGCPWQVDQVNLRGVDSAVARCRTARDEFVADVLPAMDVDLVVAIGLSRSDQYWETRLSSPGGPPGESLVELQERTTRASADLITATGARLVIVRSVYGTAGYGLSGFNPIECLAAARTYGECAVTPPRRQPAVDDVYGALSLESDDIETIDLSLTVCPGWPVCAPVVAGLVVWKDRDHITSTYLVERREAIWRKLVGTGLLG